MTGFRLDKQFFKRKGNYIKIDFLIPADEFSETLTAIDKYGSNHGYRKIESAEDFRYFLRELIGSSVLRMEEGR
jgi:hypothetical protein